MTRRVRRWNGALAGTLALVTLGLLYAEPTLFAAALVPLAYVVVGSVSRLSPAAAVELERSLEPTDPAPGDRVTVTLAVRNAGDVALTDLRLVDGVPDPLAVVEGSPRAAVALRPGESRAVTYAVVAKRGDFAFDDPVVRLRSLGATREQTTVVAPDGEETLSCARAVADAPANRPSNYRVGPTPTDSGGSGVEFHSTREYRPGDPLSRLDWRRLAKTGELTTVRFREERATSAVVVVDVRPPTRVAPRPGYPNGASSCTYAGERLYDALVDANVETSVTAVGLDATDRADAGVVDGLPWASASGTGTVAAASAVFDAAQRAADADAPGTAPPESNAPPRAKTDGGIAESSGEPDESTEDAGETTDAIDGVTSSTGELTETLLARLPQDAHVILVSPALDGWPVAFARTLAARDREFLLLSPDVAPGDSPGQFVAGTRRELRLRDVELTGASVVDWTLDDPLELALNRSLRTLLSNA
ncbi:MULTISPECIES: DUF58 domain-containing protein [Halorussus]|uniref:DUF58 domain-containing protein n=1 Tax=Halorussus TaxID=1070314 RepID=UPI00209FD9AA|nr:DUF58 domain-containing protein [Halorussus vallis]USZ77908.1 DUF58 domain-containing protein [Halorussus vallis]